MKRSSIILLLLCCVLLASCEEQYLPKPKARLALYYPKPLYVSQKTSCAFSFERNQIARLESLKNCGSKLLYPNLKATVYLSYVPIQNNLDSLLYDAYQLPSKHIIKATDIPERVFSNPRDRVYGTMFRVEGEAASQAQFFLTDSTKHFLVGSLYFYTRPNYDSLMPAARYIEKDLTHLMESLRWE